MGKELSEQELKRALKKNKAKNIFIKSLMVALVFVALFLLFILFKNQIVEIFRLAKAGKKEELAQLIKDEGPVGAIIICALEAIQMVVVFLPAEIVQISAGVSYPIWFALPLCILGVGIGATFIYLLVNVLKYEGKISQKANNEINEYERNRNNIKKTNAQLLMYILFIMPLVPFGAICYYGSGKKIPYHKYLFTCVTGVIPSIAISWVMGNVTTYFMINNPKVVIWVFITIFLVASGLLIGLGTIFKKVFLGKNVGKYTPDGVYSIFEVFAMFIERIGRKVKYNYNRVNEVKGPSIIMCNHGSFMDLFLVGRLLKGYELTCVANAFYQRTLVGKVGKRHLKFIFKKLFYTDIETVKGMVGAVRQGRFLLLFPEGRLSTDSSYMGCVSDTAKMLKKLNAQLVFVNINGNYFTRPKWSKKTRRGVVSVGIREIINSEELADISVDKLAGLIDTYLSVDDNKYALENNYTYRSSEIAEGLDCVLYKCPKCGEEFSMSTRKNHIKCDKCGYNLVLNNQYQFLGDKDNEVIYRNITEWNNYQKQSIKEEIEDLENFKLEIEVDVRKLHASLKILDLLGHGVFVIDKNGYTFNGYLNINKKVKKIKKYNVEREEVSFNIPFKNQTGIPFGVLEKDFELYYNNELYYFTPVNDHRVSAKVSLLADALYEKAKNEK